MTREPQPAVIPCSNCGQRDRWPRHPRKFHGGWFCGCRETDPADVLALMIGSTMPEMERPAPRP